MKKVLIVFFVSLFVTGIFAQTDDQIKAAEKYAKKEEKKREKEGWKTQPGPSMFEMLKKEYLLRNEMVPGGTPYERYVYGVGNAVANQLAVAQRQAITTAKEEIVIAIQGKIAGTITTTMTNAQLSQTAAKGENTMAAKFMSMAAGTLENTITALSMYRETGNGAIEVSAMVFYDINAAARNEIINYLRETIKGNDKLLNEEIEKLKKLK